MTNSPLPERHDTATRLLVHQPFTASDLPSLRRAVAAHADRAGLPRYRLNDLVLIASELAANAIRHGGGGGTLRLWAGEDGIRCEVSDRGPGIRQSYAVPRHRPLPTATGGRGLWLVHMCADTVTIGSGPDGGAVITVVLRAGPRHAEPD